MFSVYNVQALHGLAVRISGFHPGGLDSALSVVTVLCLSVNIHMLSYTHVPPLRSLNYTQHSLDLFKRTVL